MSTTIFDKLNLKQQREILVLNAPASFEPELARLSGVSALRDPAQLQTLGFDLLTKERQT